VNRPRSDQPTRFAALDLARTLALAGMVIFHLGFDLEQFGLIAPGTMTSGGWPWFARAVAASFLFIAGIGLWLAHGKAIRWHPFLRRLGQILIGAALVTVATRMAFGPQFAFFGILHSMAVSSVIGLAFLRLPAALTAVAGLAAMAAPLLLRSPAFDAPWLLWTGLATVPVRSVDFVPTLPWLGPLLLGIAAGRLIPWDSLAAPSPGRLTRALSLPGRHSLAVYLIHQPVLFAALTGLAWLRVL
jgi:uncharacterized membrane protein